MTISKEEQIIRATRNGILLAGLVWDEAESEDIPYWAACAFLVQESGGGQNVWGHDPTWMRGYPILNKHTFEVYKAHRERFGAQGVGPMQLTSPFLQDSADREGGCWLPRFNVRIGFRHLRYLRDNSKNWREAARKYNGSGEMAERYADRMAERFKEWRDILS